MNYYDELNEKILKVFGRKNYAPMKLPEIALAIGAQRRDLPKVKKALMMLLDSGSIARVKGDRFALSSDIGLISGIIEFRQNGSACIEHNSKIYTVNRENTATAFHKDKVLARVITPDRPYRRREKNYDFAPHLSAKVIRILERNTKRITGTLKRTSSYWHLVPDDPKFYYDVILQIPEKGEIVPAPEDGDKLLVELNDWTQKHLNPTAKILENFGPSHTPLAEYKGIICKYNLPETFPPKVLDEVQNIPAEVSAKEIKGRLDLRNEFVITIDPSDAKDFDDALSIAKGKDNTIQIGVHIADVSHYVKPDSAIDKEAIQRGNSTYLVGTVIPMLPFELSNGICSLVEGKDRLVKSVFLTFDNKGDCKEVSFANSVIRSKKRLSYEQAYALLKEDDLSKIRSVGDVKRYESPYAGRSLNDMSDREIQVLRLAVRHMWGIASQLRKRRMKKGSLDLDMPEIKIHCDAQGYAESIEKRVNDESHQLVEEFMLAANEAVAKALFKAKIPFISRVHDSPDEEKLDELAAELETFDIDCGDLSKRANIIALLDTINKHPQSPLLKTMFLRSLKRAVYRASCDGHFGLFKDYYAHFTSPIRRYADLVIHRILDYYMKINNMPTALKSAKTYSDRRSLEHIAEHISCTERNSAEAERDSVKIKLLEFFERQVGKDTHFDGVITQLVSHGFFVELCDSMAYGFVHSHSLNDDIYRLNSNATALVGRRTRKQYKLGAKVSVKVEAVDRFKRQIDFAL